MINKVNIDRLDWEKKEQSGFSYERKSMTQATQKGKLGASIYRLMPNQKAFPFHFHYGNDEAVYVLEGKGIIRTNHRNEPISKGDYIFFPSGAEGAHQIINDSDEQLIYLCFSTMIEPDIIEYLDSNKIGVLAGSPPGGLKGEGKLAAFYRKENNVNYYDGES